MKDNHLNPCEISHDDCNQNLIIFVQGKWSEQLFGHLIPPLKKQCYTTYRVTSHSESQLPSNTFSSWQSRVTLMVISGTQVTFHQCQATSYCTGDLTVMELSTLLSVPYYKVTVPWRCYIMMCCLMALSHYLSQCWLTIDDILWHWFKRNFYLHTLDIID